MTVALEQPLQILLVQQEVMEVLEEHKLQQFWVEVMEINSKQKNGMVLLGQQVEAVLIQFTMVQEQELKQLHG